MVLAWRPRVQLSIFLSQFFPSLFSNLYSYQISFCHYFTSQYRTHSSIFCSPGAQAFRMKGKIEINHMTSIIMNRLEMWPLPNLEYPENPDTKFHIQLDSRKKLFLPEMDLKIWLDNGYPTSKIRIINLVPRRISGPTTGEVAKVQLADIIHISVLPQLFPGPFRCRSNLYF